MLDPGQKDVPTGAGSPRAMIFPNWPAPRRPFLWATLVVSGRATAG